VFPQVLDLGNVLCVDNLDTELIACHSTPLRVWCESNVANGQGGAKKESFEHRVVDRVETDGAILGSDDKEVVACGDRDILFLAVINVGWFAV
jgi:hypothetical protein